MSGDDPMRMAADVLATFTQEHLKDHVSATNRKITEVAIAIIEEFEFDLPYEGQRDLFLTVHKAFVTMLNKQATYASTMADKEFGVKKAEEMN